jgi:hypothetical protein
MRFPWLFDFNDQVSDFDTLMFQNKWDILSYPVYHSAYETMYLYERFIDPDFSYTATMAKLWGVLAW